MWSGGADGSGGHVVIALCQDAQKSVQIFPYRGPRGGQPITVGSDPGIPPAFIHKPVTFGPASIGIKGCVVRSPGAVKGADLAVLLLHVVPPRNLCVNHRVSVLDLETGPIVSSHRVVLRLNRLRDCGDPTQMRMELAIDSGHFRSGAETENRVGLVRHSSQQPGLVYQAGMGYTTHGAVSGVVRFLVAAVELAGIALRSFHVLRVEQVGKVTGPSFIDSRVERP